MNRKARFSHLLTAIFISSGCFLFPEVYCVYQSPILSSGNTLAVNTLSFTSADSSEKVAQLNMSLRSLLLTGNYLESRKIVDKIIEKISIAGINESTLSESYYFIGVYYSFTKNLHEALRYFNLCILLKERNNEYDERYARTLFNIGVMYNRLGDFKKLEDLSTRCLAVEKNIYGDTSPVLIETYSSLITAYIELQEYEKSINLANIALSIADINHKTTDLPELGDLYNNLGVLYSRLADFTKAKIYLDQAESIYKKYNLERNVNYINLMNSMAITYGALGSTEKSDKYYEEGVTLAIANNSPVAFNFVNSYAIILGNTGKKEKGESLLSDALTRAGIVYGKESRNYFEVLNNYANFLREYKIDNSRSLEYYAKCIDYVRNNQQDIFLKDPVYLGYSLSLAEADEPFKALETIQSLLFSDYWKSNGVGIYDNPDIITIKPDKKSLKILKTKYKILWDLYRKSPDQKTLEAASNTSELIVSLLEKVRINISEEESRLILGDKYRDSYLNAIRDFYELYNITSDRHFLEKVFEYSEKSKVSGLLTSTRELKAAQFHIPADIADSEKKLQRDLSLFNARISEESVSEEPDTILINKWKENLLESTRKRDSLILVFEKQYPEYYALKYNTSVADLKDVPKITGHNGNYINYVISDTTVYVFVANRKRQQILAIPVDSSFFNDIRQFRQLLSIPSPSDNAKMAFQAYQIVGFRLYKALIDPVRKYLVSDKLLISPDNILSYIPFEAIPTASSSRESIFYRDIPYMMDEFDISYTYSATFMSESIKKENSLTNKLIAFAPDYPEPIDIKSVLMKRQSELGLLYDLPYARREAEYVSGITGGKLYMNKDARESVYKAESGNYDIIHLAMHTLLNDKDPMYSTLIFSHENDTTDDRYLKTYEIYGIPLKAKMVVLSSCNTGSGFLSSGEGILSLARGFVYSGSQSVVMSMWEIEDKSGTEIVKMFYKNLKNGNSKSIALRKARIAYLKNSDQLRSHPYFWSTLVIYGNNTPLYYSKSLIVAVILFGFFIVFAVIFYLRKRKYS